jgi:hypothetical protein
MGFPIKACVKCGQEFELRPEKPGFANRCWECSTEEETPAGQSDTDVLKGDREANAARLSAMKNMLYRKDS